MGKQWKQWQPIFSWVPKSLQIVTSAKKLKDACSLEKNYDKPKQHIKKQRHYFANNSSLVKAMVFPVVMYGCESWTIKKVEHWITDAFELWCWKRLLRVSQTARRSNQSILKEINPEYSLEGLMLKLKYFGHLMQRADFGRKDPNAGKDWRQEEKWMTGQDGWMASPAQWTWVWASSRRWWRTGKPVVLKTMGSQSWIWLSNWTDWKYWEGQINYIA